MVANKEKNFVSAVIYIRNNADVIDKFLSDLVGFLNDKFEKYEIICVNDASVDDSIDVINKFGKCVPGVPFTILCLSYFQGLEKAVVAGVDIAIGDFVFEFDSCAADYKMEEIYNIYSKALSGFDIVAAVPAKKPYVLSGLFYKIFNKVSLQNIFRTESFRVLSRRAINRINTFTDNILYRKPVYYSCGLKFDFIEYKPVTRTNALKGNLTSAEDFLYKQNLAVDSLLAFTDMGYRFSLYIAVAMILFSLSISTYSVFMYFFKSNIVEGWATIMIFLSFCFCGVFILLSIVVRYISLILRRLNQKENIIYESINKVNKN